MNKRFKITSTGGKWICYDSLTNTTGIGSTPVRAYNDCMLELEMATSDIHK